MRPYIDQTLFNVELGLLQGHCLHLVLSCHSSIRRRGVIPDCTTSQSISLGFAHNSCAFQRHCLLCDNCSEYEKKSPLILIWWSVIRKDIVLSTLAFLPFFFDAVLVITIKLRGLSAEARFDIQQSLNIFFYANFFVNRLVYTLRMKEFRKATRDWCGSANTASRSQMIEMNKVTG